MFWKRFRRRGRKETKKADPRQPGDVSTLAVALYSVGYAQLDQGNFPAAQVLFTQAIEALESEPDRHSALRASCWYRLGVARGDQQDRAGAVEAFGRAVAIFEEQHLQAESLYPRALTNWGIAQFAAMQSGA
jgi:tetratricopeptide (TPR) repeat protein